jgi:CheY-like chemotaxis protein
MAAASYSPASTTAATASLPCACQIFALVDVLLPAAEDGLRLLRILTTEFRVPAGAISIHGWGRGDALAAGAYRFLDKDSEPELLLTALRAAARPATDVAGDRRRMSGPGSPETLA